PRAVEAFASRTRTCPRSPTHAGSRRTRWHAAPPASTPRDRVRLPPPKPAWPESTHARSFAPSSRKLRLQRLAQVFQRPAQPALHRGKRHSRNLRNLLQPHPLLETQTHHHTLSGR